MDVNSIEIGDKIKLSTDVLKGVNKLPNHMSKIVEVIAIEINPDGSKTLKVKA